MSTESNILISLESDCNDNKMRSVLVDIQNNDVGLKYGGCKFASYSKVCPTAPERQEDKALDTKQSQVAKIKSNIEVVELEEHQSFLPVHEKATKQSKIQSEKDLEDIAVKGLETKTMVLEKEKSNKKKWMTPDDIIDIDAPTPYGFYSYSQYSGDIISYLRELERELSIDLKLIRAQKEITQKARKILINWIIMMQSALDFKDETLHMTISIVDRYLQDKDSIALKDFQLVGVTCIFIAAKYNEGYAPRANSLVYYTDNTYSKYEVLEMEQNVLKSLEFRLDRPLCLTFLTRYAKAAGSSKKVIYIAKYLIEMSFFDLRISCRAPSLIAAASLYIASKTMDLKFIWNGQLEYYSSYCEEDFMSTVFRLCDCYEVFDSDRYSALRNKYLSNNYLNVSVDIRLDVAIKNILTR